MLTAPADNRRYRIVVRAYGGEVKVTLAGETLISHALSAGDLTKYGAGIMHRFRPHTFSARFTDLIVPSLR